MKHLKTLIKLLDLGELNYSSVPKSLIIELQDESLIEIKIISANKKRVVVKEQFYNVYKNIKNIQDANTRGELVKVSNHTKTKKISPQDGLYLNGNCIIEDVKLPLFNNSAIFLKEFPKLQKETLVVCVENYENLIYFKTQLKYFQENNIVFIFRNSAMLKFIETLKNSENKIIYFGDFDLAGIFIYETQILPRDDKIELFIRRK